ncbi:MAG TPA: serine/threonine-protein kinase, partial [Gemmatimonadaceae bacterium]|nr:serine/threonine-protein kinase [Gemmatimonadaceae bacterium]
MSELREQLQQLLGDIYQLERELAGGMSRVFVAEETALARKVVIKVLPPETAAAVNVARFRREIQLAASLQHPHIVPLLSAGSRGDLLYYVMPLIEGESLRARLLRTGELPVSDVTWILRDATLALAYAHSHSVVHRDIKPDNILLTGKFAVVADFGVAKAVSEATSESNITSAGVALGTPTYMAPEQAVADPTTDHRADIYALGVVGYELLTGTPPFSGTSPQMILAAHVTRSPDHVTKHRSSVPPALANIIMRCLEKKAADRWQSADEIAQHLASIATSGATTPMTTAPYAAVSAVREGARRSRRPAIGAAFVLGLAAFGAMAWFAGRGTGGARFDDHRVIVSDFENQTRDPSLDPIGKLASDLLRQGLAQTGVAEAVEAIDAKAADKSGEAKPGLVVRGRYYREGGNIRFQAEILDARTSRVARALSSVTGSAGNPTLALEQLRPRVLGAIATLNDPLIANWARQTTEPPIFEAYRAYRTGIDAEVPRAGTLEGQQIEATEHFQRATQIDSTFVLPLVERQFTPNDSIQPALLSLERNRDRLTPLDRALVDFTLAE